MNLFRSVTIKNKLNGIVLFSTLGFACVLALALFLLATYGINGPLYKRLTLRKAR